MMYVHTIRSGQFYKNYKISIKWQIKSLSIPYRTGICLKIRTVHVSYQNIYKIKKKTLPTDLKKNACENPQSGIKFSLHLKIIKTKKPF